MSHRHEYNNDQIPWGRLIFQWVTVSC